MTGPVTDEVVCHFDLVAPRHFLYPSLLLLLAEEPRHGYRLVDGLLRLGFGPVGRPNVYRALSELDADGLVEPWPAEPTAGSTRHVYGLTATGRVRLREWMGVVEAERHVLEQILKRFEVVSDPD